MRSFFLRHLSHSHNFSFILSNLGRKLFSKGNVQDTHRDFEEEHNCNAFCRYFEVPTSYN